MSTTYTIDPKTVKAIDILLGLFTEEQRDLLSIKVNNKIVSLTQIFLARWEKYIPISGSPLVFEAKAAQIIETNKGWLQLMQKLKEDDFFSKLMDPENYKEKTRKFTAFKGIEKREIMNENETSNVVRAIGRTVGGDGGLNRAYDYSSEWDRADRQRLDKMKLNQVDIKSTGETGEEDDTRGSNEEESKKKEKWLEQAERLEKLNIERPNLTKLMPKFSDDHIEVEERKLTLFDVTVNHSTNSTIGQNVKGGLTFIDGLRRQNYDTLREKLILAEAINNIHNIEFIDVREKIFKKLDALFVYSKKSCL